MGERGDFRAIRRVLLDGPDFQKLSERARWVFVAMKLDFGPTGIEVQYPDALLARLAAQTGASSAQVQTALDQLEREKWIEREGNVVLLNGQLENDPHFNPADAKHRKGIQRAIAGLPRLDVVRRFIGSRQAWFPEEEASSQGLGWAFLNGKKPHRRVRNGPSKQKKEKEKEKEHTQGVWETAWSHYPKREGGNSEHDASSAWRARLREKEDPEVMLAGTTRYAAYVKYKGWVGTSYVMQGSRFYGPSKQYLESWEVPRDPLELQLERDRDEQDRQFAALHPGEPLP